MKRQGKRLLAVLLAMFMLASMSITAFAADDAGTGKVKITWNPDNGADVAEIECDPTIVEAVSVPAAPTKNGFRFTGWRGGGTTLKPGDTIYPQADITYTAQWEEITSVTITWDPDNGQDKTTDEYDPDTLAGVIVPAAPTKDKYYFTGWSGGNTTLKPGATIFPEDDITYTAQWEAEHTITYETERGTKPEDGETVNGKLPTLSTLTASGYTFKGWFVGDQEYKGGETVTGDITLTAKWVKNPGQSGGSGVVSGGIGGSSSTPSYSVSGGSGKADNGSWTTDKDSAPKGDTVTITLKPADGYRGVPTVRDGKGSNVAVAKKDDTTYTFVMPDGNVTISVEFTAIVQTIINPFVDVSEDKYYYDAVLWALENLIAQGTGDGTTFSPNDSCTRAQAVTFLWRAAGEPEPATTVNPFTDVEGGYYYKAMLWAVEKGITQGTGDGTTFSPNDTVNRGQMVTFLWRAAGKPAVSGATAFTDVDNGAYYAEAVQWANGKIVQGGMGDNLFAPGDNCTRGQVVTMLFRAQ